MKTPAEIAKENNERVKNLMKRGGNLIKSCFLRGPDSISGPPSQTKSLKERRKDHLKCLK